MKSLKKYGVKKLNIKDSKNINGGTWPWYVVVGVVSMAYDAVTGFARGVSEEAAKY